MIRRWVKIIQKNLPTTDLIDISDEVKPERPKSRQFAAQYSQSAYSAMLEQDVEVGDYISNYNIEFLLDYTR